LNNTLALADFDNFLTNFIDKVLISVLVSH
jgi:hypothetical protein